MSSLSFKYGSKTVQEFVSLYQLGQLNLEPGFQRKSVWSISDRKKLIRSIWQTYPLPSVFLYKTTDPEGRLSYHVIDGKQRLETILMFQGAIRGCRFAVKIESDESSLPLELDWNKVRKKRLEHRIMGYELQVVEITGESLEIVQLFVRINSTGKSLTGAEKRHANYNKSPFFQEMLRLARWDEKYFEDNKIMTKTQMNRMKNVEL
jgi:uncharacterized protein with ParB-like and HNH nuclease domain